MISTLGPCGQATLALVFRPHAEATAALPAPVGGVRVAVPAVPG